MRPVRREMSDKLIIFICSFYVKSRIGHFSSLNLNDKSYFRSSAETNIFYVCLLLIKLLIFLSQYDITPYICRKLLTNSGFLSYEDCLFIPFIPEFLQWTLPCVNLDISILANRDMSKISNRMTNSVDPDETAHYELSHLDLCK